MEHSARVPLLVRAPWLGSAAAGRVASELVELVDVFPSVANLALPGVAPAFFNGSALPLDGTDFSPLLLPPSQRTRGRPASPNAAGIAAARADLPSANFTGKQYAYSQFPRCDGGDTADAAANYCKSQADSDIGWMGYSVRDVNLRYTLWLAWDGLALAAKSWDVTSADCAKGEGGGAGEECAGEELYDHTGDDGSDFDSFPIGWANLAADGAHAGDKMRLRAALQAHYGSFRPV